MFQPNEWNTSDSPASSQSQAAAPAAFITLSTVDGLSYTPSAEQKSRDLAQIKATGRRSWKTLKGKAEAVWSPEL
jgi:transcriptional enhancer factor